MKYFLLALVTNYCHTVTVYISMLTNSADKLILFKVTSHGSRILLGNDSLAMTCLVQTVTEVNKILVEIKYKIYFQILVIYFFLSGWVPVGHLVSVMSQERGRKGDICPSTEKGILVKKFAKLTPYTQINVPLHFCGSREVFVSEKNTIKQKQKYFFKIIMGIFCQC